LQDVPTVVELARNEVDRQVLSAVVNAAEIGTAFFTSPGVPQDRVDTLRRAFDATMKDPDFLAEAAKSQLTVGPYPAKSCKSSSPKSPRSSPTFWKRSAPPTRPGIRRATHSAVIAREGGRSSNHYLVHQSRDRDYRMPRLRGA